MRDRLIELIAKSNLVLVDGGIHPDTHQAQEALADYLLAEGVIVPKVKIGDKLYVTIKTKLYEYWVTHFKVHKDCIEIWGELPYGNTPQYICSEATLGYNEWVYLTKEDAEKALAERSENGK